MGRPRRRLFCALAALIEAGCCASFNFYVDHGASGADGSDTQTRAWPAASASTYATARASGRASTTTRSQRRGKHAWPRHAAVPHLRACSGALAGGRAPRRSAEPRRRGYIQALARIAYVKYENSWKAQPALFHFAYDAPLEGSTKRRPPECRRHSVRTIECRLRTVTNIAKRHEYDTRLGVIPVRRLIHGGSASSRRAAKLA